METHVRKEGQWSGLLVAALLLVCIGGLSWGLWEGYQYRQAKLEERMWEEAMMLSYSGATPPHYLNSIDLALVEAPIIMEHDFHGFLWDPPEIVFSEPGLVAQCRVLNNMQQPMKKVRFSWSLQTPDNTPTEGEVEFTAEEALGMGESAVWTIQVSSKPWNELNLSPLSVLKLTPLNVWNEEGESLTEGQTQSEDKK